MAGSREAARGNGRGWKSGSADDAADGRDGGLVARRGRRTDPSGRTTHDRATDWMEEEVRHLVGERNRPLPERTAKRWGTERGYCVVMGQKVPVERPRVRSTQGREIRLGSYEMFHRGEPLTETVWEKLMLGLSTRKYGQAVRGFSEAYGLEKSAISEHFIEASRAKLKELMERRLEKK